MEAGGEGGGRRLQQGGGVGRRARIVGVDAAAKAGELRLSQSVDNRVVAWWHRLLLVLVPALQLMLPVSALLLLVPCRRRGTFLLLGP